MSVDAPVVLALPVVVAGSERSLGGVHRRLCAVAHPELGEDPPDVRLDGVDRQEQLLGDLGVGAPERQQCQHLLLARRQTVGRGAARRPHGCVEAELLAPSDAFDGGRQLLAGGRLEHDTGHAHGAGDLEELLGGVERVQHDVVDPPLGDHLPSAVECVAPAGERVEQGDVGDMVGSASDLVARRPRSVRRTGPTWRASRAG